MQDIIETLQNLGPLKWIHEQLLPFILQITETRITKPTPSGSQVTYGYSVQSSRAHFLGTK